MRKVKEGFGDSTLIVLNTYSISWYSFDGTTKNWNNALSAQFISNYDYGGKYLDSSKNFNPQSLISNSYHPSGNNAYKIIYIIPPYFMITSIIIPLNVVEDGNSCGGLGMHHGTNNVGIDICTNTDTPLEAGNIYHSENQTVSNTNNNTVTFSNISYNFSTNETYLRITYNRDPNCTQQIYIRPLTIYGKCANNLTRNGDPGTVCICSTGSYLDKRSVSSTYDQCVNCQAGTSINAGQVLNGTVQFFINQCVAWGTLWEDGGRCKRYENVPQGVTTPSDCSACAAGTSSVAGGACSACAAGTYQDTTGAASCSQCAAGTYQNETGKTSCKSCPGNATCSTTGFTCNAGYEANTDNTGCTICSAGNFSAAGGACSPCATGTYSAAGGSCTTCTAGYSCSPTGQTQCTAGTFAAAGASACTPCTAGKYSLAGGACENCAAGKYSAVGASTCTSCAAGSYASGTGNTVCTACAAGYSCSSTSQTPCAAGTFSGVSQTSCTPCAEGTFSAAGASSCTQCAAGYSCSPTGQTQCTAGTFAAAGGSCSPCAAGTISATGQSSCTPCEPGKYSAAGAASCSNCPANSTCTSPSSSTLNPNKVHCNENYYNNSFGTGCIRCPGGSTSPAGTTDKSFCTACP